jgi:hypothetical protein
MRALKLNVQAKFGGKGTSSTKKLGTSTSRKGGVGYRCVCASWWSSIWVPTPGSSSRAHCMQAIPYARDPFVVSFIALRVLVGSNEWPGRASCDLWIIFSRGPPSPSPPCFRKYDGDALWLPNTTRPAWLDGSLPGDRGFDPLGLSKPSDYVQIAVDENDINAAKNFKGDVEGKAAVVPDLVSETSLSPYSEVFGLQRFRETELIHGRWAMLGVLGALIAEGATGIKW